MRHNLNPVTARWKPSLTRGLERRMGPAAAISQMHPEGRLLVLCARTSINEFVRVEIEDLAGGAIDWAVVWRLSKAHGVASLAYRTLSVICPASVPAPIHETFRRHIQANALLNSLLAKELVVVLDALAAKGIRAIAFKGVTLAQTAYGDLGLRECADLDVIVERESIPQARQVLWSQGYQLASQDVKAGNECDEPYHFFQKKNGIIAVDLQWIMSRQHFRFRVDRSGFWDRLKPVHLPTKSVMGLCPEDLLILLCVHGSKHAWEQLKWVCDVAELVRRRPALDWTRVLFQADEWACRRMVLTGLAMAKKLFDTALPRVVLHEIDVDADISTLVHRMPKQLLMYPSQGIDEDSADALYFTLKDSSWERWKLGVSLCRDEANVITTALPWFRLQRRLRGLFACLKPFRWFVVTCIPSIRMRRAVVRWLRSAS